MGPELLPFAFPSEVEEGQLIQLSCAATKGDEPLTLTWFKDGLPLVSSKQFVVNNMDSKLSILLLRSVNFEHSGDYECRALNPVGEAVFMYSLKVKG